MDGADSCDITPPMSPLLALDDYVEHPPSPQQQHAFLQQLSSSTPLSSQLFVCQGEPRPKEPPPTTHRQGPLRQGALISVTTPHHDTASLPTIVELFGYSFVAATALEDHLEKLFSFARQEMFDMEDLSKRNTEQGGIAETAVTIRYNITQFLAYVRQYITSYTTISSECITGLLRELCVLLSAVDRLHHLPQGTLNNAASMQANKSESGHYHMFHYLLEIYWAVIQCLHIISTKYPELMCHEQLSSCCHGDEIVEEDVFYQCVQMVLWDVVLLACNKHTKSPGKDVSPSCSAFVCGCVQELVVLLVHLLQHRQTTMAKQSVWVVLMPILQKFLDSEPERSNSSPSGCIEASTCKDPIGFCWWFLSQLSPLFLYDKTGVYDNQMTGISNYTLVKEMIKKTLVMSEWSVRQHLRCLLSLYEVWEPNAATITLLWEHFSTRLNDQFLVAGLRLTGFASICKTAAGLLDRARKLAAGDMHAVENDCSYHLFLRLLAMHLTRSDGGWRNFKARIYMKYQGRRLQELTETGLQNLTVLFLVLAHVEDVQDLGSKLCDLYSRLPVSQLDHARRSAVWRGTFSLMLLHEEKAKHIGGLAEKLVQGFNAVCKDICTSDGLQYTDLWQLVTLYVDSSQEVIDSSPALNLGEHNLIGSGFADLLLGCRENDVTHILAFAQAVLTKHRILYKRAVQSRDGANQQAALAHYRDMSDALWKAFYHFLVERSVSQTPPPLLADVAAGFALLVSDMPPSVKTGLQITFHQTFSQFAWADNVNPNLSCRFLCHTLRSSAFMERLRGSGAGGDKMAASRLVHAWLRCAWMLHNDSHMPELTRMIFCLEELSVLLGDTDTEDGEEENMLRFLTALDHHQTQLTTLKEKIEFREKMKIYFGDVAKYLPVMLKQCASSELMNHIYLIGGYMAKYAANVLYVKSKPDCVLPVLIERLALPRALLNPAKPLPQHITTAIRNTLYLYVQGLGRLDYQRDMYVQRKLRDLICQYMTRFSLWSGHAGTSLPHPLMACFNESFHKDVPSAETCSLRVYLLELIVGEFLTLKGSAAPTNAALGWTFILELQKRTPNGSVIARDMSALLGVCLQYLLLCEMPSLCSYASQCLTCLVERYRLHQQDIQHGSSAETILRQFIDKHLATYPSKTFRVLESVAALCPDLFTDLLTLCTRAVKMSEAKRGVGVDKTLRLTYSSFLGQLGEQGQQERSKLLRDS